MSSSLRWLTSLLLVCASATQVWADMAPCFLMRRPQQTDHLRQPPREPECDLVIVRDPNAKEAELRIPRQMMVADASPPNTTRTAMVGLALSVAIVAFGMWCLRYRPRELPKKKLAFGGAVVALLLAVLFVVSNADARPVPGPNPIAAIGDVAVTVRIVEQGNRVELVVPPEIADKIAAR